MSYTQINYEVEKHVATITLNRPEAYNAFSDTMKKELSLALDEVRENPEIRVVLIKGAGKAFCAGGDVKNMVNTLEQTAFEKRENLRNGMAVIVNKIRRLDQPVIAVVNGPAMGAGCSLAMACDLRLASEKASFGLMFVKRGLIPDWGCSFSLPRLVGTGNALEMVLTGKIIDAQSAEKMGLVNYTLPLEAVEEKVRQLCEEISQNAPIAVAAAKQAIYYGATHNLADSLEYEIYVQNMCQQTKDYEEGVISFTEKRNPVFSRK